jgi:hypothetical protein
MKSRVAILVAMVSFSFSLFLINCTKNSANQKAVSIPEVIASGGGGGGMS